MRNGTKRRGLSRTLLIAICLALICSMMPAAAFAGEQVAEQRIAGEQLIVNVEASRMTESPVRYSSRGDNLRGIDLKVYNLLCAHIEKVAAGTETSTHLQLSFDQIFSAEELSKKYSAAELGVSDIVVPGTTTISEEAKNALFDKFDVNTSWILANIPYDLPYSLFWFDKTVGIDSGSGASIGATYADGEWKIYINSGYVNFYFAVTQVYAAAGAEAYNFNTDKSTITAPIQTDANKIKTANSAVAKAESIINAAKSMSDYDKLVYYKNRICDLVTYNTAAAAEGALYGDASQVIYVFDENPATNVVCEGYSKAFKFLCDRTNFNDKSIACYLVTGDMKGGTGAGLHMWNIVTMGGVNYLVDLTNCDDGTIGAPDKLFMKKEGDAEIASLSNSGYIVRIGSKDIEFTYDAMTMNIYADYELSIRDVYSTSISTATVTVPCATVYWTGAARTQTPTVKMNIDGVTTTLTKGKDYDVSYTNNVNLGTATVTVTGKGSYIGKATTTFKIARQPLKNASVNVSLKYSGMYYNGKARTQSGTTVVTATVGGKPVTLKQGTDYTISYKNNVNAGTATMTITGIGNYTGTHTQTFKIYRQNLSEFKPSVTIQYSNMNYTGKARTQNGTTVVKATVNGKVVTLEQGKDYTISYKNNTNVGKATMTITGKGNFKGTVTKTFNIIPPKTTLSSVAKKTATSVTVKWEKKATQTTGYLLQYSTSKTFASDKHSFLITNPSTVTKVISGLAKGKTYYFRIRTYTEVGTAKTKYYSPWSDVKSIKL